MLKLVKDPLVHFAVLGLAMFLLYAAVNPNRDDDTQGKQIVVDDEAILTFIQYRTKVFKPELAERHLSTMSNDQLQRLIDDYVREEALHREAEKLGLGREDYIIKRRLIQKVEFIAQGFAEATVSVSEEDLRTHHAANKQTYREPGNITFTHVFFSAERRTPEAAKILTSKELIVLRSAAAAFSDAPQHGERFPYGVNFVERTKSHVASQFGDDLATRLFEITPADNVWHGPYSSPHGAHLVMLVKRVDERDPPFEELRSRIEADIVRDRRKARAEKAIRAIVKGYNVKIELSGTDGEAIAAKQEGRD